MALWLDLLSYALLTAWTWMVIRRLNPMIDHVRARHGLAMAWGTAILGIVILLCGIGLIVWVEFVMLG